MRRLKKAPPIQAFTDCIHKSKPANWDEFSGGYRAISQEVRLHILCDEQDSLCGYTELPIEDLHKCHIDHFRKRSLFQRLTFDWNNFVVATMDDDFGAKYKDNKSGITKALYLSILNPVVDDTTQFFEYSEFGEIIPKQGMTTIDREKAEKTREVFNLNHAGLVSRRLTLIKMIESYTDLPAEDIQDCLKDYGFRSLVEQYTS